jgi:hypothetical protein
MTAYAYFGLRQSALGLLTAHGVPAVKPTLSASVVLRWKVGEALQAYRALVMLLAISLNGTLYLSQCET